MFVPYIRSLCVVILILLYFHGTIYAAYSAAKEMEIRKETLLAASYDMISRPEAPTMVKVGISILAIDELDLKSQRFEAVGWVSFEWLDSRITWTPSAKDDIEYIFSEPEDIWKPELFVDNSLEDLGTITDDDLHLRVRYDGTVEWEPPRRFVTQCDVDITYYPYDQQSCSITIASLGYTMDEVVLETFSTPINLDDIALHGEWEITSSSTTKVNLTETLDDGTVRIYPQIQFKLHLVRRPEYYNLNVIMPIILTSLLVALTFIVPVDCGEKLSYILTVFLSLTVLLTIVADSLPSTSITTSVLGLYLALVTILAAIGILLTVLILITYNQPGSAKSPSCMMVVTQFAAKITCSKEVLKTHSKLTCVTPISDDMYDPDSEKMNTENLELPWKEVATILDRFCFIMFLVITVCMNISFIIALVVGGKHQES